MKKLALLSTVLLLVACGKDSPRTDQAAVASPYVDGGPVVGAPEMRMEKLSAQDGAVAGMAATSQAPEPSPPDEQVKGIQFPTGGGVGGGGAPTMLIRAGDAVIEVEKVDPAIVKIRQLATRLGGYVAGSSISGGREQVRQATLELKIPAARYDQAVAALGTVGRVETVNSSAQDVGEEFVDITARVANAKRLEDRLASLLATHTGKLDDVLRVERELARVREEIERYEGRLRFLTMRAALSTLNVTVHEPGSVLGTTPGDNPIAAALRRAWQNFVGFIAGLIALLGIIVPLTALAIGAWYAYPRLRRRLENRLGRDKS